MAAPAKKNESATKEFISERTPWRSIHGLLQNPVGMEPLFDAIPIGVVILDRNRNIVFFNQAAQALTGYSSDEAFGIPCKYMIRSGACDRRCPVAALRADSEAFSVETDVVNRLRQRISVRVTAAPLTDPNGNLIGYIESIEDIQILKKLDKQVGRAPSFEHIIGQSPEMQKVFDILPVIAGSDSSVLITGETGTGKDFAAEAIHNASERAAGSFIKVNCGALPETLMESELFGHIKGAFTGAVENKPGRFKLAHNGTLYLTEIGDLPLQSQAKLLMFLDDRVIFPVGGVKGSRVNVRVIAATHRNLEAMARQGKFREDLLFRLNVVRVHLPPLRERRDDVLLLMDHFLAIMSARLHKRITGFSAEARAQLANCEYPGNVRELRNVVEYAITVCDGSKIALRHLPTYLTQTSPTRAERAGPTDMPESLQSTESASSGRREETWAVAERRLIMDALVKAGGRKQYAAELLGWGRSTLWRKIRKYGIDADERAES
jgi:two-component system, NtrC family, response regulator AtoC